MIPRRRARQSAFQFLYSCDLNASDTGALTKALQNHLDHFQVPKQSQEFSIKLVQGIKNNLLAIDCILEKHTKNWKLSRLSTVDRNLLRLGIYELHFDPDSALMDVGTKTPKAVVINEAVDLANEFGSEKSASFINGILDAAAKDSIKSRAS